MGGTFDPIHNAHLELAERALNEYELETVLFIPTGKPVRKLGHLQASTEDRLAMTRLSCEEYPAFEVLSLETEREGLTYTIDTLHELCELYAPEDEFFLIVGEDALADLSTWKDSEEIAQLVVVLYAKRPGSTKVQVLPPNFTCYGVEMPERDISSSMARKLLESGKDASKIVPAKALAYINECGLYGIS